MTLWSKEADDLYHLKTLTEQDIQTAENMFGIQLPPLYLELLQLQNGGMITYNACPSSWQDVPLYIDHILGIGEDNGLLENDYYLNEWEMPKELILISGDGHNWFAFDYRKTTEQPPVVYIDNEFKQIYTVAPSFEEFLNQLYVEDKVDDEEFDLPPFSKEEMKTHIKNDDIDGIIGSLHLMTMNTISADVPWVVEQLLKLSQHDDTSVRTFVASSTYHLVETSEVQKQEPVVQKLLQAFAGDSHEEIREYGAMIETYNG